MGSKFIVPLRLLELESIPALPLSSWHKLYYRDGYLKTLKSIENDVVLDRPLDGFIAGPCTPIVPTDTVLEAFQKLQCQVTANTLLDTFLELTDTPNDYTGSADYALVVNSTADAVEFIPFPDVQICGLPLTDLQLTDSFVICRWNGSSYDTYNISASSVLENTWDIPIAAFVDENYGSDLTAVLGDGNKPYATIAAALAASDHVIIKPGTYSQIILLNGADLDNKHIHCMAGVVFGNGSGFIVQGTGVTSVKFTGDSVWNGDSIRLMDLFNTNASVLFECSHVEDCIYVLQVSPAPNFTPTLTFNADYINCNCLGTGYAVGLRSSAVCEFNVKSHCSAQHTMWMPRERFRGSFTLNCPETRVVPNYTSTYGSIIKHCMWMDTNLNSQIIINGDFVHMDDSEPSFFGVGGCLRASNLFSDALFPDFTINGNVYSLNTQGILSEFRSAYGVFAINGDIINIFGGTGDAGRPIQTRLSGWGGTSDQQFTIRGNVQGPNNVLVGRGKKFYFYGAFILNIDSDAVGFNFETIQGGSTPAEVYVYHSALEVVGSVGTTEVFTGDASLATTITGLCDVKGTEPTVGIVDTWSGYTQLVGLITPRKYTI